MTTLAQIPKDILDLPANIHCADCHARPVTHLSLKFFCFLCEDCSHSHASAPSTLGNITTIKDATLSGEQMEKLRKAGNKANRIEMESTLPFFYRRPYPGCPVFYRHEFIVAKYINCEFVDNSREQGAYNCFSKKGVLMKKLRDQDKYVLRHFFLEMTQNSFRYLIKENDKTSKAAMDLDKLNACLLDSEVYKVPQCSMMINYVKDGSTRNIFVHSDEARNVMDWYNALRCCKFHRICLSVSGMDEKINGEEIGRRLTQDILLYDWLEKTGPKPSDPWRKRWVYILGRKLLYSEEPLSAYPRGEVFLGSAEEGYSVVPHSPENWRKHTGYCFTVYVPQEKEGGKHHEKRSFVFLTNYREVRDKWVQTILRIIDTPVSLDDLKYASVRNSARVQSMRL